MKWESTSRESYAARCAPTKFFWMTRPLGMGSSMDMKPTVYFTRDLTPAAMLRLYGALGVKLEGKVAVLLDDAAVGNGQLHVVRLVQDVHLGGAEPAVALHGDLVGVGGVAPATMGICTKYS